MSSLRKVSLDETYEILKGRTLLSSSQALTRLAMIQHLHDREAGHTTAGFISGYQGSPIAAFDLNLSKTRLLLDRHNIVFRPAVNEELAATACWGTQQLGNFAPSPIQGVHALWYGKGPGLDRATDAIKHGNHSGTHPLGGVLAVVGDDHSAKSSTVAHNSEVAMSGMSMPVIYPAGVDEFIDYGLLGWAMSRYTGLWTGFKGVNETIGQTATVDLDVAHSRIVIPDNGVFPPEGVHYNSNYTPDRDDILVTRFKLPLVHLFARANALDRVVTTPNASRRLGIITAGKSFNDVRQALMLLGIDESSAPSIGINILKLGLIWPIDPQLLRSFAQGHEEVLVIEEKKPFIELQVASILYDTSNRPRLLGKQDDQHDELFPADVALDAVLIANVIGRRLQQMGLIDERLSARMLELAARLSQRDGEPPSSVRTAFFCSGCPHSSSTKLPKGSQAMAGIGCHGMAAFARTDTLGITQMGGEGATWIGAAPFVSTPHVFQNLGDGTYYHSGLLAIRSAVAAGINITYKILYNDGTAMTGGQPIAGPISVGDITRQVVAEGANEVVVVSDRPELFGSKSRLAPGTRVYHRHQLDTVQSRLRDVHGVTVLIYEQTCAAEKRRRRKRQEFPDPPKRMFINEAVCEGCGDCSVQSNCISLFPVETALGRKRVVDQSTCNKDYSCVKGFCPSFVTVHGASVRRPESQAFDDEFFAGIPAAIATTGKSSAIMIAGIGGTGVVTVGSVLAMAAHIQGDYASTYDMVGIAQKGGAVYSHIRIAGSKSAIGAQKISTAEADLLIGCDMVASGSGDAFQSLNSGVTRIVANSAVIPTSDLQKNPDAVLSPEILKRRLTREVGDRALFVDASSTSLALLGDTIGSNFFLVGVAQQGGALPLSTAAIEQAIELNAVAVTLNRTAFRLGRLWVHDQRRIDTLVEKILPAKPVIPETVAAIREHRSALLTAYQDTNYARRYQRLVDRVAQAESDRGPDDNTLTRAVAFYFAKLMTYKDEYEVARLYTDPSFKAALESQFRGEYRLGFNLAPPLFSRRDPVTGHLKKREYGPWVFAAFGLLTKLRFLRGTWLDPFGPLTGAA